MTVKPETQDTITVRPVETIEEYRACQDVQRRTWGITEEGYVVPIATMISVQHAGGLVLGAFLETSATARLPHPASRIPRPSPPDTRHPIPDTRLVGFAFGYLGRVHGEWCLYSQLAGVDPDFQDRGIGGMLKRAQREWARQQGLALVVWSFDPMQAGNANLNLHRLGAISRTYQVNYFGVRSDALNAGLDTDRLLVEWQVAETPRRWQGENQQPTDLIRIQTRADGLPLPATPEATIDFAGVQSEAVQQRAPSSSLSPFPEREGGRGDRLSEPLTNPDPGSSTTNEGGRSSPPLRLDIPPHFAALKQRDAALAHEWQLAVRGAFQQALAAGYLAMDFVRGQDRAYYVLRRPDEAANAADPARGAQQT
ncbi:MAG: GNAT family N-acetyltransferase [Dehalococcoidia bacterium]